MCGALFPASKLEVDHIIPAGSLTSYEDIASFTERLLCDESNMRLVCKACHADITLAEKVGCAPSDAWKYKEIIEFKKLKAEAQKARFRAQVKSQPPEKKADREEAYKNFKLNQ